MLCCTNMDFPSIFLISLPVRPIFGLSTSRHCASLGLPPTCIVSIVNRKKSIKLSKGESMSLYTREPGVPLKSMEVYGLKIRVAKLV